MRHYLLILLFTVIAIKSNGQLIYQLETKKNSFDYEIKGTLKNSNNGDTLILGFYRTTYSSVGTFAKDTAVIKNNNISFKGKGVLEEGMYFIFDKKTTSMLLPLIITEQKINFECDMKNIQNTIKFFNSPINTTATKYQNYLGSKMNEKSSIEKQNLSQKELTIRIEKIGQEINEYRNKIISKNSNNFFGMFLKTTNQLTIPDSIKDEKKKYNYFKSNYWSNFDLTDERILNTSNFYNTLNDYFEKYTYKNPDSIISSIDVLTNFTLENPKMFEFVIEFSFYKWEKEWKNIMGMDKIIENIAADDLSKPRKRAPVIVTPALLAPGINANT